MTYRPDIKKVVYMSNNHRSLFREDALMRYRHRREKDIFPQLISPPVFLCSWLLLGFLLVAALFAWWGEIPTFIEGSGAVIAQAPTSSHAHDNALILIFLPRTSLSQLHPGQPVHVQIGSDGPQFVSPVASVGPESVSPSEARRQYALDTGEALAITQPSVAVIVKPRPALSAHVYVGSLVYARVQVGTRRVISLLPGLNQL